jgi:hypothetical protein
MGYKAGNGEGDLGGSTNTEGVIKFHDGDLE